MKLLDSETLSKQWLASKSAKDHLLVFRENYNVSKNCKDFDLFLQQFKQYK